MKAVNVIEWLIHLIANRLIKAFLLEPPCTAFSVMRRPALRSRLCPFGFDPVLAHRSFQAMEAGEYHGVTGALENPWASKIMILPGWDILAAKAWCQVIRCDSCAYGSIHLKSFAFMCVWADVRPISKRCSGDHEHVQIQGTLTEKSATYVEGLAEALAEVMAIGIERAKKFDEEIAVPRAVGLENQLVNELGLSLNWQLHSSWTFKVSSHINILELAVVVRLMSSLVKAGKYFRVVVLVDPNVVKRAASKGRSSAKPLQRSLCRLAALAIAGGICIHGLWILPTRWNPANDPTMDTVIRGSVPGLNLDSWFPADIFRLSALPRLRRWASSWARLVMLLSGPDVLSLADQNLYRCPRFPYGLSSSCSGNYLAPASSMDFDSTCGFPGEGPFRGLISHMYLFAWLSVVSFCSLGCHGLFLSRNSGDIFCQAQRQSRPPLQAGRPVLGITNQTRDSFLEQFGKWLKALGISLDELLADHVHRIDEINSLLVRYGRNLYGVGRPYNHYAETLNAIASWKPAIRRQLQEAWNLAFAWVRDEPSVHHIAMPWQILLAAITVCLSWGWLDVAGMFALTWGALFRVAGW